MEEVNNMKIVKTQEAEYLFTLNPNAKNMDAEKEDLFRTTIYKSLFFLIGQYPIFKNSYIHMH